MKGLEIGDNLEVYLIGQANQIPTYDTIKGELLEMNDFGVTIYGKESYGKNCVFFIPINNIHKIENKKDMR